jgi:hypothetical protein
MLSSQVKARIARNKNRRRYRLKLKQDGQDWMDFSQTLRSRLPAGLARIKRQADGAMEIDFPLSTSDDSTNPNNCLTCDHHQNPDGGHCYMFRDAPTEVCMQHTGRQMPGFLKEFYADMMPRLPDDQWKVLFKG